MQSHEVHITWRQFLLATAPTLATVAAAFAILHLAARCGWLQEPPTALHGDETGLRHQARATVSRHPARLLFVGDSTCGAGVNPIEFSRLTPGHPPALNLGLVMGIELGAYADQTADFASVNPGQLQWVVLLLSPHKLATPAPGPDPFWQQLRRTYRSPDHQTALPAHGKDGLGLGLRWLREHLAARVLPEAFRGRGAELFGFTRDLDAYLTAHGGSYIDPGTFNPARGTNLCEWLIDPSFASECREFRRRQAPGTRLAIGLTPIPEARAPENAHQLQQQCLRRWGQLIAADLVLTNLPATLPNASFGASAHLNAIGQQAFTEAVAHEMSGAMP